MPIIVLGFGGFLRPIHSLLGAVIGALTDLVPVLIDLDVGAFYDAPSELNQFAK